LPERIRLMDEYGSQWPLWSYDVGQEDRPEWNLPPNLREELSAWALEFDQHFEVLRGWDEPQRYRSHLEVGTRLAVELQKHLGDKFNIELVTMSEG
jgi:hypothetical protein